ncbi:MAG: Mur ligase family protein [Gudongella sp.]|jgi:UDP-N-acetylmuramoyl-L-alanyl-D-glutamate--2,6-diaminopimelate ligase|nr:Mur ligase family protein [Gudongella sp.]
MKISDLFSGIEVIDKKGFTDSDIKGIAYHSDRAEPGFLYVAIRGYKTDGHLYIGKAVEKGAIAAVVEEFTDDAIPQIQVKNSRRVLSKMGSNFYGEPSKKIKTVGVTATNGKTTTTFLVDKIYELHGHKTGIVGSVLNKTGKRVQISELTTPESLDLQELFFEMVENCIDRAVMEVSSSAMELYRAQDIDFDIVSFANFSREHIDQHGTFERYWEVKSSLITEAKKSAVAVLNFDYVRIKNLADKTKAATVNFSIDTDNGDVLCKNLKLVRGRAHFDVEIKKDIHLQDSDILRGKFKVELGIPGYHSVENAMAAICIALADGVPIDVIKRALKEFHGVERRFEFIFEDEFIIVDDHFANIKNINSTLGTLADMEKNKLHIIYAIRGNRGPTVNRENAEALVSWKEKLGVSEITATKSIGSVTWKDEVSLEEESVFREVMDESGLAYTVFDTLQDAIVSVLDKVANGDIILLAGCQGMDRGARIAIDKILEMRPLLNKEKLYSPLAKRVSEHLSTL